MISGGTLALKTKGLPLMPTFVAGRGKVVSVAAVVVVAASNPQERSMSDSPLRLAVLGYHQAVEIRRFQWTCDGRVFHLRSHRCHLKNVPWRILQVADGCWGFWGRAGAVNARLIVVLLVSWNGRCRSTVSAPSSPTLREKSDRTQIGSELLIAAPSLRLRSMLVPPVDPTMECTETWSLGPSSGCTLVKAVSLFNPLP
jgi:hypothetical protein